jgi:hypothetical protein
MVERHEERYAAAPFDNSPTTLKIGQIGSAGKIYIISIERLTPPIAESSQYAHSFNFRNVPGILKRVH